MYNKRMGIDAQMAEAEINDKYQRETEFYPREKVVDPLAFYLPCMYHPKNWGIYFRMNKITDHFIGFLTRYRISSVKGDYIKIWIVCIAYIYWHELTHHIVEDICTLKDKWYSILSVKEEEGLAEWHAFATATMKLVPSYMPNKRFPLVDFGGPVPITWKRKKDRLIIKQILSALYSYMNRQNDPIYKPIVYPSVVPKIGKLWMPVREASERSGNVYFPYSSHEEVYTRIYLTNY